ncbi:RNA polymerase sigma factor [Actinomadura alba]|uniref:RNA polymerase sigma factor n=1 Tax=Actinomadura alba TaxID=406431 RepID=UPI001C9D44B1|nr:RNA polymerase sigma factor [Actinomadura alba]
MRAEAGPTGIAPVGGGIEDTALAARARQGRLDAFEELSRRHYRALYRVALRMLGDVRDAEDATQEAFERAWLALPGFEGRAAFRTWIYRILTNVCLKNRQRHRHILLSLDEARDAPDTPQCEPQEIVERADRARALRRAIAALPPEQRSPLVLREYAGCSYQEIAQILGISMAAVRGRLHRARVELMEEMRPWA